MPDKKQLAPQGATPDLFEGVAEEMCKRSFSNAYRKYVVVIRDVLALKRLGYS